MKRVLILLIALFAFTFFGCVPNVEHDCQETYHPENTYAILRAEQDRINEFLKNYTCGDFVTSTYVDDYREVLVVGIKDITDEKIEFFKENISDKDFIVFEEGGNIVLTTE
ncbi:MAG: hypothetical protein IJF52_00910 [Clostridia bacterium]|nr:hypothetical protein [Clostridia bacterium]